MARGEELADVQWGLMELLLPEPPRRADGCGRPWHSQRAVLGTLAEDLRESGQIDLPECYVDGTFIVEEKGEQPWVLTSGAKA